MRSTKMVKDPTIMSLSMAPHTSHLLQIQSLYWKNRSFSSTEADRHYHDHGNYHDYHDLKDAAEDPPSPRPGAEWTFDPSIGIVHPQHCSICRSYTKHVFIANKSDEPSFNDALSAREMRVTATFTDGVRAGRLLQQEHDNLQITCYREERDKALHSAEHKTKVLDATWTEVQALRDQVLVLRATINELSTARNDEVVRAVEFPIGTPHSDLSSIELDSSIEADFIDDLSTPPLSPSNNDTFLTPPNTPAFDGASPNAEDLFTAAFADETAVSDANALFEPSQAIPEQATSNSLPKPASFPCRPQMSLPAKPSLNQHSVVPMPASKPPRRLTTLTKLQAAMKAAHEGDQSSLKLVRALKAFAQGHPPQKRTKLHRYVMKHWREPPTLSLSSASVHTTLDGQTFSTEIYVDASQWGIGFLMDGLWFAWKFADHITANFCKTQIDSNWAEMLAVEVGLLTVIHWVRDVILKEEGDLKSLEILIQSDNAGVVKAIEKRHTNHPLQQDILRRILEMAKQYDVRLTMKWIPSLENLADKTSRGVRGNKTDLLPFMPPLTSHLSDILCPVL